MSFSISKAWTGIRDSVQFHSGRGPVFASRVERKIADCRAASRPHDAFVAEIKKQRGVGNASATLAGATLIGLGTVVTTSEYLLAKAQENMSATWIIRIAEISASTGMLGLSVVGCLLFMGQTRLIRALTEASEYNPNRGSGQDR